MIMLFDKLNIIFFVAACAIVFFTCVKIISKAPEPVVVKGAKKTKKHKNKNRAKADAPEIMQVGAKKEKWYIILLCASIVIGVIVRLWQFGNIPAGFNQDGAMAAVDGKALADYATDRFGTFMPAHLYAWGYGQMSSLLSYLIAVFVKIFGLSPVTARLPQLLVSLCGGIFFFLFMKDVFGRKTALISAFFVALNPWHIMQSRWALDCNLFPHFFMGGLYFLNRGLTDGKKFVYISMLFFGLCMYCYGIAVYTVPVFLIAVSIYYIVRYKRSRLTLAETLISAGIYILISWPFFMTMAVNFFKWNTIKLPFVTIQLFSDSMRAGDILLFSDNPKGQLISNIKSVMNVVFMQKEDLPWNDIKGFGTMYKCTMPFVLLGVAVFFKTKTKYSKGLILFAFGVALWAGILTNNVNINRINIIFYPVMMLACAGISAVTDEYKKMKIPVICIYAVLGLFFITTYFTTYAEDTKAYFYGGFGEALADAEESGAERIYVTADAQGEGYAATSEILTLFYDKTDALYFQGKTNVNNEKTYLPYKERFIYTSMTPLVAKKAEEENAALVIMKSDTEFFDMNKYDMKEFGNFCSLTKK